MMSDSLDEELMNAVITESITTIPSLLDKGADPCRICSSGKTALGAAAQQGDVVLLELLLDWCKVESDSSRTSKCTKTRKTQRNAKHAKHKNQGYYIMVHDGGGGGNNDFQNNLMTSPTTASSTTASTNVTPEGMEAMAWDEPPSAAVTVNNAADTDEWAALYRWYACILERTASLIQDSGGGAALASHGGGSGRGPDSLDAYRKSALHYAAERGHALAVRALLVAGVEADPAETLDVSTPLHAAAANNHTAAIAALLEGGAKPNRKSADTNKSAALHITASRGFKTACELLLRHGASADVLDASERTPLLLAVNRGHEEVADVLLAAGARVNAEEIHGYTPLCEAVWRQSPGLVGKLLARGARVTQSHRLLHYCAHNRCTEIARRLLQHGGSVSNLRDEAGDTPLLIAARTAQPDMVRLLLENGASAMCRHGLTGSTALHEAVDGCCSSPDVFRDILHMLRRHGACLNARTLCGGETPLYRALLADHDGIAEVLIKEGADVNACDLQTCIVDNLTLAQKRGNLRIVKLLVYAGFRLTGGARRVNRGAPAAEWLSVAAAAPLPLSALCRIAIRRRVGGRDGAGLHAMTRLGLPRCLVDYLMLDDV